MKPSLEQAERQRNLDVALGRVLRAGLVVSLAITAVGLATVFAHHPEYLSSRNPSAEVVSQQEAPHTFAGVFRGLASLKGESIIAVGLLLLIVTPVLRVAVSAVWFFLERDRVFGFMTLLVLTVMLISFLLGKTG